MKPDRNKVAICLCWWHPWNFERPGMDVDVTILTGSHGFSWFGERIFAPLHELCSTNEPLCTFHSRSGSSIYQRVSMALHTLSWNAKHNCFLLFTEKTYLRILLLETIQEQYKEELAPPQDFAIFNQNQKFLQSDLMEHSPTTYGTTLTLGNSGVAATRYLTRYFSHSHDLFDANGNLYWYHIAVQAMKELIEAKNILKRV